MKDYIVGGLAVFIIWTIVFIVYRRNCKKLIHTMKDRIQYDEKYLFFLLRWKNAEQRHVNIAERIRKSGYSKVAVYGMGELGWIICNELLNAGLDVAYAIDKNADKLSCNAFSNIPDVWLKLPEEDLEPVDLIIVTALKSYSEIKAILEKRYTYKIMSIEDFLE